jgi:tetratricopeptide (TPR) repeat protein
VLEAYEIFSDPRMRVEVARAEAQSAPSGAAPGGQPLSKLERLRQRMPFKIPKHLIEERQLKAREFYYAAQQSEHAGNLVEAASSLRIAICFDSSNRDYRAALVDMQARSAEIRATKLLEECGASYTTDADALRGVLKLLEDVLLYRPHHPALNHRAAHVALMLDEVKKAREYAETALEHSPDVAAHHTIVGMVHRAAGEFGHAKKKFDSAIAIDPNDVEARKELATLRLGRRTPVQEG